MSSQISTQEHLTNYHAIMKQRKHSRTWNRTLEIDKILCGAKHIISKKKCDLEGHNHRLVYLKSATGTIELCPIIYMVWLARGALVNDRWKNALEKVDVIRQS